MMTIWRRLGVDILLKQAHEKGTIMCGLSAGSICWFRYGNSDSRRFNNPAADLIKVSGLNLINVLHCPHYDVEKDRKPDLKKMMKKSPGLVAIALDNNCAIEILDDTYRVISARDMAMAYRVYWKRGVFREELIEKTSYRLPLAGLIVI
jgi:dipeptidase E